MHNRETSEEEEHYSQSVFFTNYYPKTYIKIMQPNAAREPRGEKNKTKSNNKPLWTSTRSRCNLHLNQVYRAAAHDQQKKTLKPSYPSCRAYGPPEHGVLSRTITNESSLSINGSSNTCIPPPPLSPRAFLCALHPRRTLIKVTNSPFDSTCGS